ncbi:uracil-DNA glycosylase [Glutamicibacter mysorens]|uniref:Uracil-DNA glycosylase n=1 Tax=Glutamicibacter mysorens TaxID=257984 RepID=A0ABX4MVX5_9MICC|nr:uracil-DNA glycosylase [Glutamicibacter mysorens]PJJ42855.1 uracil-DNA glycosylase [Glutamicibacter mysorens]
MDDMQPALFDAPEPAATPVYDAADFPFYHGAKSMADHGFIAVDWVPALSRQDSLLRRLATDLAARSAAGEQILPAPEVMFRALSLPLSEVKVLIIGQDPYPTPGHPNGLAFAANKQVRPLPRSLANIYKELQADLGLDPVPHPDLGPWLSQGVLLLNQVLSVTAGNAGSHQKLGWAPILQAILQALDERPLPLVALLWGNQAQKLSGSLPNAVQLQSAHPSPLSASRGFFGSKPFSNINRLLSDSGQEPIDWSLPRT